ncbi:MAG: ABC transporter ATP-binding protein [Acidimicrobiia bacterium]
MSTEATAATDDFVPKAPMRRRLATLRALLARADRRFLVVMVVLIAFLTVAGAAQSLALKWMVNGAIEGRWTFATVAAVVGGLAAGVLGAAGRVYMNLQDWIATRIGAEIEGDTLNAAATMPGLEHLERPDYLDQLRLVNRAGDNLVRSVFAVTDLISLAARIAIGVWLLATVNPVLVLVPIFAVPSVLFTPRAQAQVEQAAVIAAERARASDHLHRLFSDQAAAMEMRVFDCGAALDARADQLWHDVAHIKFLGALKASLVSSTGWAILAIGYVGALAVVALDAAAGTASPGDVLLVSQLALQLRGNVAQTTTSVRQSVAAMRLTDRFLWLQDLAAEQTAAFAGSHPPPTRITNGISFDHVTFAYPGTDTPVLNDLTFELPAGSTVALVGENGAGKTTLVKLLCRFYNPTHGRVTIDDFDLASVDPVEWRTCLAGSFQDYLHLETTANRSVGLGDPPWMDDNERVVAALERADSRRLPERWPQGLATQLGKTYEDGIELSGGQWQRVAIARGMMRITPLLLILDEPTAALDPSAEQALYNRYASTSRQVRADGGVVLLVSHRFSSVRMADLIVVLHHGTLTEIGTHEGLLAADGHYAHMYQQQAAAYT